MSTLLPFLRKALQPWIFRVKANIVTHGSHYTVDKKKNRLKENHFYLFKNKVTLKSMVKLRDGVMERHHKQFSTQEVMNITTVFVLFICIEHFVFKELLKQSSGRTMIITPGRCHISQSYQSAGRISPAFRSSRVAHRTGLGQKRDSPWYHPYFKPPNEPCFTGLGNSGLRAGPQGNFLSLAPYQLCSSQWAEWSLANGDNICVNDMKSLVLGLWLAERMKKQHLSICPWTGPVWIPPS